MTLCSLLRECRCSHLERAQILSGCLLSPVYAISLVHSKHPAPQQSSALDLQLSQHIAAVPLGLTQSFLLFKTPLPSFLFFLLSQLPCVNFKLLAPHCSLGNVPRTWQVLTHYPKIKPDPTAFCTHHVLGFTDWPVHVNFILLWLMCCHLAGFYNKTAGKGDLAFGFLDWNGRQTVGSLPQSRLQCFRKLPSRSVWPRYEKIYEVLNLLVYFINLPRHSVSIL